MLGAEVPGSPVPVRSGYGCGPDREVPVPRSRRRGGSYVDVPLLGGEVPGRRCLAVLGRDAARAGRFLYLEAGAGAGQMSRRLCLARRSPGHRCLAVLGVDAARAGRFLYQEAVGARTTSALGGRRPSSGVRSVRQRCLGPRRRRSRPSGRRPGPRGPHRRGRGPRRML